MRRETEADDLEKMSFDGERSIYRLCDQSPINGRQRRDVKREKEREERGVAEMDQNLARYKRERGKCQPAAREMREEEARLDQLHTGYMEQAEEAERKAILADEEAARLERGAGPAGTAEPAEKKARSGNGGRGKGRERGRGSKSREGKWTS